MSDNNGRPDPREEAERAAVSIGRMLRGLWLDAVDAWEGYMARVRHYQEQADADRRRQAEADRARDAEGRG